MMLLRGGYVPVRATEGKATAVIHQFILNSQVSRVYSILLAHRSHSRFNGPAMYIQ